MNKELIKALEKHIKNVGIELANPLLEDAPKILELLLLRKELNEAYYEIISWNIGLGSD